MLLWIEMKQSEGVLACLACALCCALAAEGPIVTTVYGKARAFDLLFLPKLILVNTLLVFFRSRGNIRIKQKYV